MRIDKKAKRGKAPTRFRFAHELINQLSLIVGHCELLKEDLPQNPKYLHRLSLIQDVARSMCKDLKNHQQELEETRHAG